MAVIMDVVCRHLYRWGPFHGRLYVMSFVKKQNKMRMLLQLTAFFIGGLDGKNIGRKINRSFRSNWSDVKFH